MNKLISFVKQFTKEDIKELNHVEKVQRSYFYTENEIRNLKNRLSITPYSQGLFFGELIDKQFKPGFPLLDLISAHTSRKVIVSKKGETMFLFKNNILEDSIIKLDYDSGPVLVVNEQGEVLGYGDIRHDRGSKIIKNILNRSDFLKREN